SLISCQTELQKAKAIQEKFELIADFCLREIGVVVCRLWSNEQLLPDSLSKSWAHPCRHIARTYYFLYEKFNTSEAKVDKPARLPWTPCVGECFHQENNPPDQIGRKTFYRPAPSEEREQQDISGWYIITNFDEEQHPQSLLSIGLAEDHRLTAETVILLEYLADLFHHLLVNEKQLHELRQAHRESQQFLSLVPSAVFVIDRDQRIILWNKEAEKITGFTEKEILGRKCKTFALYPCANSCGVFSRNVPKPIRNRECRIRTKDGRIRVIEKNADLVLDDNGNTIGAIESFTDITQRLELEKETRLNQTRLKETNEQLKKALAKAEEMRSLAEQASQVKSDFLANMSHEIRTPLHAIVSMAHLLAGQTITPRQKEMITTIRKSSDTLLELINDILDFSKIEAGRLKLERTEVDLFQLMCDTVEIISGMAAEKGLEIILAPDPTMPYHILADSVRLRQIMLNLLSNAVKFTEQG
ncbi:MAG: PAS domain-containing hybrid sensor histidine kinase/response regulator, partial [Lentisphaerae bacterium]